MGLVIIIILVISYLVTRRRGLLQNKSHFQIQIYPGTNILIYGPDTLLDNIT